MNLKDIIYEDECNEKEIPDIEITKITTDQNDIDGTTLFVFVNSIKFDIRKIISYVISKRPAAIICEETSEISTDIPTLKVTSSRRILPYLYARFYEVDFSRMRFVGITGTNGKTTTATILSHILNFSGERVGFIGTGKIISDEKLLTDNTYSMTTPDPVVLYKNLKRMQNDGCSVIVMEVSSHALYFDKVLPIPFFIGIMTNLSLEHSDFHTDMESYFKAKMKLFSQCKYGIFNSDDHYCRRAISEATCEVKSIGAVWSAEAVARDIRVCGFDGSEYIYRDTERIFKVKLALPGIYNIYNSMLAINAAILLGVRPCIAKKALETLTKIDGRFEIVNECPRIIIDYAHTPDAFEKLLKFINSTKNTEQNLITVFGCGGERDKRKRPEIASIVEKHSDFVIVTEDNSRGEPEAEIIKDILSGFSATHNRKVITSRRAAIEYAILSAAQNDIIAIVGKGHERYNIGEAGIVSFDERDIIKDALKKRSCKHENQDL